MATKSELWAERRREKVAQIMARIEAKARRVEEKKAKALADKAAAADRAVERSLAREAKLKADLRRKKRVRRRKEDAVEAKEYNRRFTAHQKRLARVARDKALAEAKAERMKARETARQEKLLAVKPKALLVASAPAQDKKALLVASAPAQDKKALLVASAPAQDKAVRMPKAPESPAAPKPPRRFRGAPMAGGVRLGGLAVGGEVWEVWVGLKDQRGGSKHTAPRTVKIAAAGLVPHKANYWGVWRGKFCSTRDIALAEENRPGLAEAATEILLQWEARGRDITG